MGQELENSSRDKASGHRWLFRRSWGWARRSISRWWSDLIIIKLDPHRKLTSWPYPLSYETTTGVQKLPQVLNFPFLCPSARSGAIKPTLSVKRLKNLLSAANSWNCDKIVVLVHLQKVLGLSWFFVCWFAISLTLILHPNHSRSSQYSKPRCAQTHSLFQIVESMRFCAKYVTEQNDTSDWMRRYAISLEW